MALFPHTPPYEMPNAITQRGESEKPTRRNLQSPLIYREHAHGTTVFGEAPILRDLSSPSAPARVLKGFKKR